MTGPSLGPRSRCPFAHCSADLMLVVEQASPGNDEDTLKRVPQHQIVGEAERFGQCPASLMVIPLDTYSRDALKTQAQAMGLMLKPPGDTTPPGDAKPEGGIFPVGSPDRRPHPLTPRPSTPNPIRQGPAQGTRSGRGGQNVNRTGHLGQTVVPLPDEPHAGPGPGRASKPFQPTASDVDFVVPPRVVTDPPAPTDQTQQQGSTADMSDNDLRSQLIALTRLAIEGFGQQQEQCAALTAALDGTFSAVRKALEEKQQATHTIALAAVGSRSDIPQAAANMIGASASIESTLAAVTAAQGTLQQWVDSTHAYAGQASSHAQDYLAQI